MSQIVSIPFCSGKYPMPTPIPVLSGALMNVFTVMVKASHRVGITSGIGGVWQASLFAGHCIEPDLSSMTKMSVGIWLVPCLVAPQLASGSTLPEPPAPPVVVVGGGEMVVVLFV